MVHTLGVGCLYLFRGMVTWRYLRLGITTIKRPASFMLHIGKHIKRRLEELERSPAWLAKKINCDRTNIYKIFNRSSIDTELLARISKALEYDFFIDLSKAQENKCDKSATNL